MHQHGNVNEEAFSSCSRCFAVDGDYADKATFTALVAQLDGGVARPLHYLAIPPSLFETVVEALASSGCAKDTRVVVEKPFGRDLLSARELKASFTRSSPRVDLPDRPLPRQGADHEPPLLPLCERVPRADLEPVVPESIQVRWPRTSGSRSWEVLRGEQRHPGNVQNHLLQVAALPPDGPPSAIARTRAAMPALLHAIEAARPGKEMYVAHSPATATRRALRPIDGRDMRRSS